ncbi:MAG: efflux RND transporter periplasmic adaptor subunit [Planctomycetota bacterium]|jgi:multidrug efflux pump subunit AcrA (membrane-fusion protein)
MLLLSLLSSVSVAQGPPATKVVLSQARMLEAPTTITLVGTLTAVRRSRVGSEISGIVARMPVRQGDRVEAGDVLCELNADSLRHQLEESRAKHGALRAQHAELLAGTREEDLRRLKALVDEASAEFDRWKAELSRVEKLYAGTNSNAKEMYDTKADYLRAQRRKIAAEAAYDLGVEGPRQEAIERAAFDVAAQQAVVDRIQSEFDKAVIRSPFTGFVASRAIEMGEWLSDGGEVVELVDLSTMLARVQVPESALPYLSVGAGASVHVDAVGAIFPGSVKHIIRLADATARTFPVDIEVNNASGKLAAGMFVRATVPAGETREVIAVPKDAVVQRSGNSHVAITMPGERGMTGMLMPVSTGIDVDDWVTITSNNVRPGMDVIIRGNERMLPFPMPIVVVDEHGTPIAMPATGERGGPGKDGSGRDGAGHDGAGRDGGNRGRAGSERGRG